MIEHSRLVKMKISNIGCIGPEGLEIELDNILTIVGSNNTGKSTVLRAYELATGTVSFTNEDRCIRGKEQSSIIEIWVHIPENTPNIPEKWKSKENDLLLVKSKWEWDLECRKTRQTWDPESNGYAEDGKASGLDTVFNSRLPKPFRVGTLDEPSTEHTKLLNLILQPISEKLKCMFEKEDSDLRKTLTELTKLAQIPVKEEHEAINSVANELNKSHNQIFPNLSILFDVGIGEIEINPVQLLLKNSKIKFKDWTDEIDWNRQGTGSQRALFWSIMQVRSKLATISEIRNQKQKELEKLKKEEISLQKKIPTLKQAGAIEINQNRLDEVKHIIDELNKNGSTLPGKKEEDISLPGYMLLIDEPEVGLHPSAIRAASKYLYSLASDPSWQVMITTHSPQFVNPLHDHTTIVRLERNDINLTPRTYRSDRVTFSDDEKNNLKMLNRFDQAIAEMFFGQRPLIIEGDTEFAAFEYLMNKSTEYPLGQRPLLIRARGKDTICLIIRMLTNFKVSFAVLHDSDFQTKSVAWSANRRIYDAVIEARKEGCKIIHRVSIPTFEYHHLPIEYDGNKKLKEHPDKDKPWNFLLLLNDSKDVLDSVKKVLDDLITDPNDEEPFEGNYIENLTEKVDQWIEKNCPLDNRFVEIEE